MKNNLDNLDAGPDREGAGDSRRPLCPGCPSSSRREGNLDNRISLRSGCQQPTPTSRVTCSTLHATLPATSCALRHLKRLASYHGGPAYPDCARCPRGADVVAQLERAGWTRPERIELDAQAMRRAYRARATWLRERFALEAP